MPAKPFFVVISFILLSGCDLDKPLSDPATAKVDQNLLGHWVSDPYEQGDSVVTGHLFVGKHTTKGNPNSIMEAIFVLHDAKGSTIRLESKLFDSGSSSKVCFSVTEIDGVSYANTFWNRLKTGSQPESYEVAVLDIHEGYKKWEQNPNRSCRVFRYKTDGKQLTFSMMNPEMLGVFFKQSGNHVESQSVAKYLHTSPNNILFEHSRPENGKPRSGPVFRRAE
jgi:hypothetical protein